MLFEDKNQNESLQVQQNSGAGPQGTTVAPKQSSGVAYGTSAFYITQKNQYKTRGGDDSKAQA